MTGLTLICSAQLINSHSQAKLSFSVTDQVVTPEVKERHNIPTFISIPSVSIGLPVSQTSIINGIWEIDKNGVSHLSSSAYPGDNKGVIMYAHNTHDRFEKLHLVNIGDQIAVTTRDSKLYKYKVSSILVVSPNEVDVLMTDSESLILYTCTGFADLKRLVVIAERI